MRVHSIGSRQVGKKPCVTAYLLSEFTRQKAFWNHEPSERAWRSREMRSRAPCRDEGLPAGGRSRPRRRRAGSGSEPKRAMATRRPRAAARAFGASRVAVLGFWTTARPTSDSRPAGWGPTRRCLASEALGAGLLAADAALPDLR